MDEPRESLQNLKQQGDSQSDLLADKNTEVETPGLLKDENKESTGLVIHELKQENNTNPRDTPEEPIKAASSQELSAKPIWSKFSEEMRSRRSSIEVFKKTEIPTVEERSDSPIEKPQDGGTSASVEKPAPPRRRSSRVKPIWDKFVKGVQSRQVKSSFVVWDSMIKKLNRIRNFQKSSAQLAAPVIADMFTKESSQDNVKLAPSSIPVVSLTGEKS